MASGYGKKSKQKVARAMLERKRGTLRSGPGGRVPRRPGRKKSSRSSS
jgi:hypothetical protein